MEGEWREPTLQEDATADNFGEVKFTKEDMRRGCQCITCALFSLHVLSVYNVCTVLSACAVVMVSGIGYGMRYRCAVVMVCSIRRSCRTHVLSCGVSATDG